MPRNTNARKAARSQLPLVQFMAPARTSELTGNAVRRREMFWISNLTADVIDLAEMDRAWMQVIRSRELVREARRGDLGLEASGAVAVSEPGR
jgi:hypothetical protein